MISVHVTGYFSSYPCSTCISSSLLFLCPSWTPQPCLDNDFGSPRPQVVPTQLFREHLMLELVQSQIEQRDGRWRGVRGGMGWRWLHSQEGDCRVALLLRSGRKLIPWIYNQMVCALKYSKICDCTPEIHFFCKCKSAHGHGAWFNLDL